MLLGIVALLRQQADGLLLVPSTLLHLPHLCTQVAQHSLHLKLLQAQVLRVLHQIQCRLAIPHQLSQHRGLAEHLQWGDFRHCLLLFILLLAGSSGVGAVAHGVSR